MDNNVLSGLLKALLIIFVIAYIVSPLDGAPGPVDDIIVALLGLAGTRRLSGTKGSK